ncbi:antibiotic biosynthesis monooxygenase [Devosia sp. A8/3-2]|nr:antibiotic biosynthesis monooxygenase [Devosia sp. A8/3-2]
MALTRAEPGCLSFSVTQSPDNPIHFLVSETFANQSAFDAHQHRASTSARAEITAGLQRHYSIRTE